MSDDPDEQELELALQRKDPARVGVLLERIEWRLMYGHGCAPYCNITDARDMPVPVFGPETVARALAITPFFNRWWISRGLAATPPLSSLPPPRRDAKLGLRFCLFENSMVDRIADWFRRPGRFVFFSEAALPEPMKLDLRLSYSGRIKVWINRKPVFTDRDGKKPFALDNGVTPLALPAGRHAIKVAMESPTTGPTASWGFLLRFVRRDARHGAPLPQCPF